MWDKGFQLSLLKKDRLEWVDYLRGIAIILVVYRHALIGIQRSSIEAPAILTNANMIFYSFRMPLFFLLSGIFISGSIAKKSLNKLIEIKFENLFYPYLIWTVIQITLQIIFGQYTNSSRGFVDYTYILYHPRNLDQFWYLPALFNATVVFLITQTKFKPSALGQLVFGMVLYLASPYFQKVSMMSDWMEFYIFFAIGNALSGFFFKPTWQKFLANPLGFLILIPLFVATQLYYLQHDVGNNNLLTDLNQIKANYLNHAYNQLSFLVIALVGCLTMFKLSFLFQKWKLLPFLRIVGYHSLQIYVMHVIVTGFVRLVLHSWLGVNNAGLLLVAGIVIGVLMPILLYNFLIKDSIGWFLFSYKKRKASPFRTQVESIAPIVPASLPIVTAEV